MTVYDFAPDLDLSKEVEGSIFGVKGVEVKDSSCAGCILNDCYKNKCLLSRSVSCVEGDRLCRYEQAAIEGGGVGGALG